MRPSASHPTWLGGAGASGSGRVSGHRSGSSTSLLQPAPARPLRPRPYLVRRDLRLELLARARLRLCAHRLLVLRPHLGAVREPLESR